MTIDECIRNISKAKCVPYSKETKHMVIQSLKAWKEVKEKLYKKYPKNWAGDPELGGCACLLSLNQVLNIIDEALKEVGKQE